ncbi:MAG: glycosyltransferase family 2 protein [Alphaproteobacteria bacterium]|nr:glycosyltransferase family 2 protein [Alphaproteobacteria bacterium]
MTEKIRPVFIMALAIVCKLPINSPMALYTPTIAVLLPCYNEATTLAQVIADFRAALPEAHIYVFDNNSTDDSAAIARAAGAIVAHVPFQGKGNVVRRMFADVDADIYVMADADSTYDAARARELVTPILNGTADTVVAVRDGARSAFPPAHVFGNRLFNVIVQRLFGRGLKDIFSGYRSFSRRFVKSFPAHSERFEIETEMSIFMLEQRIPMLEIPMHYGERPAGSFSKLHTYRDGARIIVTIFRLFKEARPFAFFSLLATLMALLSLLLALPVILTWMETGLVERQPTLILCTGIAVLSALTFLGGMMLDSLARTYRETRHLRYLNVPPRG